MKRLLSICLVLLLIGSASALPLWGPAQGFRNPGAVELGSLTIDGVSIDGGDVSYDEFVAGMVTNETAINASIAALLLAAYTNETAINTSIAALTVPLVSFPYTADVVDQAVFTASGGWVLTSVVLTPTVAGTGEGAATVMVKLCDSAEAPASGDAMLNSTLDLEGTIHTPQTGALTTDTGVSIPDGKIVALDFTGTLTSSVGSITLYGKRA